MNWFPFLEKANIGNNYIVNGNKKKQKNLEMFHAFGSKLKILPYLARSVIIETRLN
jgi:hypothetical protein